MHSIVEFMRRQQFKPGPLAVLINPFFLARRALWLAIASFAPHMGGRLLDVGCGTKPYRELFKEADYVGLEIDAPLSRKRGIADYFYDGARFPFGDAVFDCVLCNQVLEHVFHPNEFLSEIVRVLRPGGKLLLTVPFVWDEHEQPYDYARYSSFGLRDLLERNGLELIEHRKLLADASVIFQLVNAYLYKVTRTRFPALNVIWCSTLMAPVTLVGLLCRAVMPANPDLFLDQIAFARKKLPTNISRAELER